MAMDFDALGTKTAKDILTLCGQLPEGPAFPKMKEFWTLVAKDFVEHIQKNAEVPAGIAVSTTGNEFAQSGATTAAGNVK
jgi:hypothetical protein